VIDQIRVTLTALRGVKPPRAGDLNVLRITDDDRIYLGVDESGHPHLVLLTDAVVAPASDIATVSIGVRTLVIAGDARRTLVVSCLFEALAEVFDHFVAAIMEKLSEPDMSPGDAVVAVLDRWRRFLVAAAGPPGRDTLAAVFGELILLRDIVAADDARRIDCWVGPFGARHDIRRASRAIEVKTTRAHTSRVVTIHGEDQLLEPDGGTLHIHLVRLEEAPESGQSVTGLVDGLLDAGVPAEELYAALTAAGVPPADLGHADSVRFDVRERLTVPVDDACPRIIPRSFTDGARPVGVVDLTYRLDLDHILDRALSSKTTDELLKSLAGAAGG